MKSLQMFVRRDVSTSLVNSDATRMLLLHAQCPCLDCLLALLAGGPVAGSFAYLPMPRFIIVRIFLDLIRLDAGKELFG